MVLCARGVIDPRRLVGVSERVCVEVTAVLGDYGDRREWFGSDVVERNVVCVLVVRVGWCGGLSEAAG